MLYTHLAAALLALALGFGTAWKTQEWRHGAKEAERLEQVAESKRINERAADGAATGHEKDKAKAKVQYRTIYQEVERVVQKPIYRNVCLDDDGVRLISNAIGAKPAASEPASSVSGLKPTGGWLGRFRASVGTVND